MTPNSRPLLEAQRQLELIEDQLLELRPGIYRGLALYLQQLRQGLLQHVQQAVFHLATQVYPERYGRLTASERAELQHRLRQLVRRCGCLLTVEQLRGLGRQLQLDQQRSRQELQERILQSLEASDAADSSADGMPDAPFAGSADQGSGFFSLPEGSVRLGMDLPLSADLFTQGFPGLMGLSSPEPGDPPPGLGAGPGAEAEGDDQDEEGFEEDGELEDEDESELQLMQSLFALASQGLERQGESPLAAGPEGRSDLPGDDSEFMPHDPSSLLNWWEAQDRALQRRLRNLSHAINVDMLRLRLSRSLMPLNLLDAVLQGQIDALPAPSNLLRLQLPFASPSGGLQLETLGLLLRCPDLEYAQPALRTCRKRLEQHRSQLRKMAHHHRHWQRRVQALEAEQKWLQDSSTVSPTDP